jgi:hypothetical protein
MLWQITLKSDRQALFYVSRLWTQRTLKISGAFAEFHTATIGCVMSVLRGTTRLQVEVFLK